MLLVTLFSFTNARYIILYPLFWLLTKSPVSAMQSVLHVLFLPTPFKQALAQASAAADPASGEAKSKPIDKQDKWEDALPEEVLKPGALYRECSVVTLKLPSLPPNTETDGEGREESSEKDEGQRKENTKGKEKEKAGPGNLKPAFELDDDGEYGGEAVGRLVWEWYEARLKEWEAREKVKVEAELKVHAGKEEEVVEESEMHPKVVVTSPSG